MVCSWCFLFVINNSLFWGVVILLIKNVFIVFYDVVVIGWVNCWFKNFVGDYYMKIILIDDY